MARPGAVVEEVVARTQGYAGGVNIRDAITQLAGDEARIMENGVLDERGAFSKRLGCQTKTAGGTTPSGSIIAMYPFYRSGQLTQIIVQTSSGQLLYTTDPTASPVVWTSITTGLSNNPMSFETFNSKVYMSNGVDNYAWWDGTTFSTSGSAPKGKYLRLWKDTMWVSGVTGLPDRVYSSDAGNAESYPVANWVDIAKGDGDEVTALASDGLFLIVGKRRRAAIIYDPSTLANRMVDFEKGFESHKSVIQVEGTLFFVSRRGICEWYSDSPARVISGKIDPFFSPNFLNLGALDKVCAYAIGNRVGWAFPEVGSSVPTVQLEYYPRLAGVTPFGNRGTGPFVFHRMPVGTFATWRQGAQERLFAGHPSTSKVFECFAAIGTDDGGVFEAILETGALDFGSPTNDKHVRYIRVLGRGVFVLQLKRNFAPGTIKTFPVDLTADETVWGGGTWGDGSWGPSATMSEKRIHSDAYGRFIILRYSDSGTDTTNAEVPVGSKQYSVQQGGWTILQTILEGAIVGRRD